ncbi:MAG: nucleotidyltransferase domain-containing protein [Defluviitaleaceae bacterium]|nr:nucleotidyltransferase domain-containing protein [Defluviitaleaceae bacterium]
MNSHTYSKGEIIELTKPIFSRYAITRADIFGSYAQDTATPDSDIDFVVEFSNVPSLFLLGQLKEDLELTLNKQCDLVTRCSLQNDASEIARNIERSLSIVYS